MSVRPMAPHEVDEVRAMMRSLWPDCGEYDFADEHVFVWERNTGRLGGFISVSLRPWAEGCETAPVPYVEGWWVAPDLRGAGVGRQLMNAVEDWCRANSFTELGSDVEIDNSTSLDAHAALGFEQTMRLQFFRKILR